jgi:hypothetical protein
VHLPDPLPAALGAPMSPASGSSQVSNPVSLAGWLPVGILAVVMVVLFVVGSLVTR